jgi:hypothetical protein
MRLMRVAAGLCAVLAYAGCSLDTAPGGSPYLVLAPVLDSLFVGDVALRPSVTYYDGVGGARVPTATEIRWASSDTAVLAVDSVTGRMTARRRGLAFIIATVQFAQGAELVVVSNTLDLTLLLDTIYVMPGDTLTVPVAVLKQNRPPDAVVWYEAAASQSAYLFEDTASGRLKALAAGGPFAYIVHADTLADTGAVNVLSLGDTTGGKVFFSILGTVVTHVGGSATAVNYRRTDNHLAFRLSGTHPSSVSRQTLQITLPDSVVVTGSYPIDSLSPSEAGNLLLSDPAICAPPRPWALWTSQFPSLTGLSRPGGTIGITQIVTVLNGKAISGRFTYTAQRVDLYTNPLGVLAIRGSFVVPLVTDLTTCK